MVMLIYREDRVKKDTEKKNIAEIIVAKHRNGPLAEINLMFRGDRIRFYGVEKKRDEAVQS